MSVPYNSTPPATWAARPAGTVKYDRTPERPIKRRRFISDSTEEVGPFRGIRSTTPCQPANQLIDSELMTSGTAVNILLSPFSDNPRGQKGTIGRRRV